MHAIDAELAAILNLHQLQGDEDAKRCTACGVTIWSRTAPRQFGPGTQAWLEWLALDGRNWNSFPEGGTWVTYPDERAPSCPPQGVEARCPWEEDARRYGGVWGEAQHETAMRTWCKTHQMAVADCHEPGPYCPGHLHHEQTGEEGRPGPCTGREDTCKCMCPVCCGDTPDMYGYEGDY